MIFILAHQEARKRACEAVRSAPDGHVVRISPPSRNLDQNAALHARIGEIAKAREWAGKKWDLDTWKRLLMGAWCRATGQAVVMLPALDGMGVEIVFRRSSGLTKAECSSLLDWINAWESGNG